MLAIHAPSRFTHPLRLDHLLVIDNFSVHFDDRLRLDDGPVFDQGGLPLSPPQDRLGRLADAAQHEHVGRVARRRDRTRERRCVEYPGGEQVSLKGTIWKSLYIMGLCRKRRE